MRRTHWILATMLGAAALVALAATQVSAQEAETAPDDTWVSIGGTVVSTTPSTFRLDYGDGVITVEMDDFDFWADGRALMENDEVIVYGQVDDELFEDRTIEASSVYVENLRTSFYASAADEEDFMAWTVVDPIVIGQLELTGTVTHVTGREFTVDAGLRRVQVDTSGLTYNPMDDSGFLQIEEGDVVKVSGDMDDDIWDERELLADWVVELQD